MRLNAVHTLRTQHKIVTLCRVLRVNRSTYYKHFSAKASPREIENQELRREILEIYIRSKKRFGAPKIQRKLEAEYGRKISLGRVYRLKKTMNFPALGTVKPRFKAKKKEENIIYENKLKQQFNPNRPNAVWVSDITYQRVGNKWSYICVIIDLFGRKLIAWNVRTRSDSTLTEDTLAAAMRTRGYPRGILFHSDRGLQYTSERFRKAADRFEVIQSFSAKAHPYDNAVAESFFKFLKLEELDRKSFHSEAELKLSMTAYANWYNRERPHSANSGRTPNEMEDTFVI